MRAISVACLVSLTAVAGCSSATGPQDGHPATVGSVSSSGSSSGADKSTDDDAVAELKRNALTDAEVSPSWEVQRHFESEAEAAGRAKSNPQATANAGCAKVEAALAKAEAAASERLTRTEAGYGLGQQVIRFDVLKFGSPEDASAALAAMESDRKSCFESSGTISTPMPLPVQADEGRGYLLHRPEAVSYRLRKGADVLNVFGSGIKRVPRAEIDAFTRLRVSRLG